MHPSSFFIIKNEKNGCDRPGQRVRERYSSDLIAHGNCDGDPQNSQDTDAKAGHECRSDRVAAAAAGTGQDFNADVTYIGGRNGTDHDITDLDNIGVAGE